MSTSVYSICLHVSCLPLALQIFYFCHLNTFTKFNSLFSIIYCSIEDVILYYSPSSKMSWSFPNLDLNKREDWEHSENNTTGGINNTAPQYIFPIGSLMFWNSETQDFNPLCKPHWWTWMLYWAKNKRLPSPPPSTNQPIHCKHTTVH